MFKKFLGALIVSSHLVGPAFSSCNDKLLNLESDSLNSKILSGISLTKPLIQEKLEFLYNEERVEDKYKQSKVFESLYKDLTEEINNPNFSSFSRLCYDLYKNSASKLKTQVAIHMLLEKVSEKYLNIKKLSDKHEKMKEQAAADRTEGNHHADKTVYSDADKFFDMFSSTGHIKAY